MNDIGTVLFYIFHPVNLNLFEKLKKGWHIFFVSGVFENFDVHFWTVLKADKVRS